MSFVSQNKQKLPLDAEPGGWRAQPIAERDVTGSLGAPLSPGAGGEEPDGVLGYQNRLRNSGRGMKRGYKHPESPSGRHSSELDLQQKTKR